MIRKQTREVACPAEEVAAYLDDELDGAALEAFEAHLSACAECATELRHQRQLLCTLDAAFTQPSRFDLPGDFTRVVAAHAESDLTGIRHRRERRRALQLCALLALSAFALLGAASGAVVIQPAGRLLRVVSGVSDLLWQTIYEATVGVGIILRMIGRAVVASPNGLGVIAVLVFLVAVSLLPRLIANYHRAQIIE
jgi:anti-sigma factor RsiW